ncbi:hypothetical protein LHFGNBLO_003973 [Mesorhizobium sp. AR10]|uniref:hypothetical protein n=1 Tax=Mesorhizobium sp. AR10 TaxID=2865839 RepID=UPI0021601FB5|nr:hypothetical protein [Mesorhizobium sp. AR10]UVK36989.1 hypothetical protein LHFGNBLO_003973 [Mesorhizobium sp. AR10]
MRFGIILAVSGLLAADAAHAEDKLYCNSISDDEDLSDISLGVITGRKVNFLANEYEHAGCPSADPSCKKPAFVRAKDKVVYDTDVVAGGYVCAAFVDGRGNETDGWLPAASIKPVTAAPHWIGTWKRDTSAEIDITLKAHNKAEVSGSATHGTGAATHEGSIGGVIDRKQAVQGFATDGDKQVAYEAAGEYDCAVKLRQLGRYLFVADNRNCGGANVSFSGVYVKR